MNFIKRSFKSITRKKIKTIILLCVVFLLTLTISVCLIVSNSVNKLNDAINDNLSSSAVLYLDYAKLDESGKITYDDEGYSIYDTITIEDIEKIADSKYVKYYDYNNYLIATSTTLKKVENEDSSDISISSKKIDIDSEGEDFTFTGTNVANLRIIQDNKAKVVDGRTFNDDEIKNNSNSVLIYKEFAELNNLKVGDTINFAQNIYKYSNASTDGMLIGFGNPTVVDAVNVDVKIVGILNYTGKKPNSKDEEANADAWQYYETINTLYAPNGYLEEKNKEQYTKNLEYNPDHTNTSDQITSVVFVLNDSKDLKTFIDEETAKLPYSYYVFSSELSKNESILAPVNSMQNLFNMILIGGTVVSILVLTLLIYLFVRDRQKEMGIYISIGEKRRNVVFQILIETLVVAFIGITLSLPISSIIAGNISTDMLKSDLDKASEDEGYFYNEGDYYLESAGIGSEDITNEYLMDTYNTSLDVKTILLIYVLFTGTVIVSIILPSVYIFRLSPKKIMM